MVDVFRCHYCFAPVHVHSSRDRSRDPIIDFMLPSSDMPLFGTSLFGMPYCVPNSHFYEPKKTKQELKDDNTLLRKKLKYKIRENTLLSKKLRECQMDAKFMCLRAYSPLHKELNDRIIALAKANMK